jgi:histidinol-phosphate aminotransferase
MLRKKHFSIVLCTLAAALLPSAPLLAQHEFDYEEDDYGPVQIGGNENAFGFSQEAAMAIMQAVGTINRYPRAQAETLVNKLAASFKVTPDHIIVTPGSGPILVMAAMAYAEPGKNVVTVEPGYLQLTSAFRRFGGEVKAVPLNDKLEHDLAAIEKAIDANTVIVYICNPNNPTGTVVDPAALKAFIERVPENVLVFVDEAYLELAEGGLEKHTMAPLVAAGKKNVLVCRTFSKAYGMAGLRVGYAAAAPAIINKLRPYSQGGPSTLGYVGAAAALDDLASMQANIAEYQRVRKMVTDALDALQIKYAEPHGSFVFMHTGIDIREFQRLMEAENIFVGRPFPPMLDWARVSIGTEQEMNLFLGALRKILASKGRLASR